MDLGRGSETRWVLQPGGQSACEEIELLAKKRTAAYEFSLTGPWVLGTYGPWSAPYRSGWEPTGDCEPKPADAKRELKTPSGAAYWTVNGSTACEYQDYVLQPEKNVAVWSDSDTEWQHLEANWEPDGSSSATTERTTKPCQTDDGPDSVPVPSTEYRDGPCTLVGPPPMLVYYRQRQTVTNHYYRPHVWSDGQERWIDGTPEMTPYNTDYGAWTNIGSPMACPLRSADERGALSAGKYVLSWEHVQIELTVPADASVSLSWRERDDGPSAAVLTVAGEGELVVEPQSPLRTTRPAEPQEAGGNVLSQIAASLRLIEPVTEEP